MPTKHIPDDGWRANGFAAAWFAWRVAAEGTGACNPGKGGRKNPLPKNGARSGLNGVVC